MKTNVPQTVLFLLSLLFMQATYSQNLVTNGAFTNGSTGWSTSCTIEINPESVYGSSAASASSNNVTEIDVERCINQQVCIFPGVNYTFSFRGARRTSADGSLRAPANAGITIRVTGVTSGTQYINDSRYFSNTTFSFSTQTYTFSIPSNATDKRVNVQFTSYNNSSTYGVIVDDIDLHPTAAFSINGTSSPTMNVNSIYSVVNVPVTGVSYSWNFIDHATPLTSTAATPTVAWSTTGARTITTALSNGTCTVTTLSKLVAVTATLPVTLTGFRAKVSNEKVYLTWMTQQEENNRYFIIERSADGNKFDSIGVVAGTNTSTEHSYTFTDQRPLSGTGFYRLKQVDLNGVFAYSSVVNVITGSGNASMQVYPNPARQVVNCNFSVVSNSMMNIQVANASGVVVLQQQKKCNAGVNRASFEVNNLPGGIYYLRLTDNNGQQQLKTFAVL